MNRQQVIDTTAEVEVCIRARYRHGGTEMILDLPQRSALQSASASLADSMKSHPPVTTGPTRYVYPLSEPKAYPVDQLY